jgi:hypothetical protein
MTAMDWATVPMRADAAQGPGLRIRIQARVFSIVKIELTENEYRLLLDFVFMANWMIHSHHPDGRRDVEEYDMLLQKLYSFARAMGCGELVHGNRQTNEYSPTRYYEETTRAFELIEEYGDDTFWDALISRLAERDVYEQAEKDRRDNMGIEEYWERSEPIEEAYFQEFRRHALERLRLVEG